MCLILVLNTQPRTVQFCLFLQVKMVCSSVLTIETMTKGLAVVHQLLNLDGGIIIVTAFPPPKWSIWSYRGHRCQMGSRQRTKYCNGVEKGIVSDKR